MKWQQGVYLLVILGLCSLTACRVHTALRSTAQEQAFRDQYVGKPFYTGYVLRPYESGDAYLIDLTGELPDTAFETSRAGLTVALGTPITIVGIEDEYIVARVEGFARLFQLMVLTKRGSLADLAAELAWVLSETPPLPTARPAMQPFIARRQVTRGMSRREVYMSWGQPDKVTSSPGSSGYIEEWIYYDRRHRLYLTNGFVTNWQ
ncbi:hypothetical protein NKDENANG_00543 [Candidatus Entotheonellaceae bacterium PAL068K]